MSQSPPAPLRFPPVDGLTVRAEFDGGAMSSDVGPLIRRGVDPQIGLTTRLAEAIDDQRHPADITPPRRALIAQRIFQIGGGYEDGNDANARRTDPLFKLGLDRRPLERAMDLASGPTFSRLENAVSTKEIDRMALALADGHTDVLFGLAGHRGLSPRAKPLLDANRQRQGVRDTNARRLNPPLPARPRSDHAWEYPAGTWPPAFRVILKAEGMTFDDTPPLRRHLTGSALARVSRPQSLSRPRSRRQLHPDAQERPGRPPFPRSPPTPVLGLHHARRTQVLIHPELAQAQPATVMLTRFKIAVRVVQDKDRVTLQLPSNCPPKALLHRVTDILFLTRPPPAPLMI